MEAKHARTQAAAEVLACENALANVQFLPGYELATKELHRKDRQANLDKAIAELATAEEKLATFNVKATVGERTYFDTRIQLCLLMSDAMHDAFVARKKADNISAAELTRRALAVYLAK
jgi:hypothetical protein